VLVTSLQIGYLVCNNQQLLTYFGIVETKEGSSDRVITTRATINLIIVGILPYL